MDGERGLTRREALGALGMMGTLGALGLPAAPAVLRAQPERAVEGTDLGNLAGTVEWAGREIAPRLSFLDRRWKSLAEWKSVARPAFLDRLALPPAAPVRAETLGREERPGFTIETIAIHASPAYSIPARVLVPTGRRGRMPAVVALHCHGGQYAWGARKIISSPDDPATLLEYRDKLYGGRAYPELLARRGYVVLVIDAFYFGERRLRPETLTADAVPEEGRAAFRSLPSLAAGTPERIATENRVAKAMEAVVERSLLAAGTSWPAMMAWDDVRSVDYLIARPDVDARRIGCVGLSGGALRAAHLVAADARIRAASITAWMTDMGTMVPSHARRHTWMAFTPAMRPLLDLPDFAALVAPGALLVQQCSRDTLFPMAGMRAAVDKLAAIYTKAGIAERFRGTFYDEPHSFRPAMQDETLAWLDRWL